MLQNYFLLSTKHLDKFLFAMTIKQQSRILLVRQRQRHKLRQLSLLNRLAEEIVSDKPENMAKNSMFHEFTELS